MQIILVSRHLKTAKTITIMPQHLLWTLLALFLAILLSGATFSWLSIEWRLPLVEDLVRVLQNKENQKREEVVTNNLQMMAARLGELQAQLLQLDSFGERLAAVAGIKREASSAPAAEKKTSVAGQGGPLIPVPQTYDALQAEIDRLRQAVEARADELVMLEARLLEKKVRDRLLPTTLPVKEATIGSGFGVRSDPIAGVRAMHEGLDFKSPQGTPVVAAAAGVVLSAEYHPEFGYMIDLDHGDGLTSRYAHLSRMDAKPGQLVRRAQKIGEVGNTGRSTGAHLHFEVRMLGRAQDPALFLRQGKHYARNASR